MFSVRFSVVGSSGEGFTCSSPSVPGGAGSVSCGLFETKSSFVDSLLVSSVVSLLASDSFSSVCSVGPPSAEDGLGSFSAPSVGGTRGFSKLEGFLVPSLSSFSSSLRAKSSVLFSSVSFPVSFCSESSVTVS